MPGLADELQTPPHRHGLKLCGTPFVYRQIREIAYLQSSGHGRGKSGTPLNVRFGKRLGILRKEKGWTFIYLSEHSGLDTAFLHALEHGTKEPCLNTLDILAKSFDLTISDLMRGV